MHQKSLKALFHTPLQFACTVHQYLFLFEIGFELVSFEQDQAVSIKSIQSFLIQEQDTLSSLTGVSLVISFLWNFL